MVHILSRIYTTMLIIKHGNIYTVAQNNLASQYDSNFTNIVGRNEIDMKKGTYLSYAFAQHGLEYPRHPGEWTS